jgi:hypothetical protein
MEKFFGMEQQKYFELSQLIIIVFEGLDVYNEGYRERTNHILDLVKFLGDYSLDDAKDAIREYVKRNKNLPSAKDIFSIIKKRQSANDQ